VIPVAKTDPLQFAELAAAAQSSRFSEDEEKILVFLAERPKGYPSADDLAQALQQKPTRVKYYIDRLKAAGLVGDRLYANSRPTEYYLRELGRAYVVENGLI
jgi:DNA-binding MarR family transcriptional regulator